MNQLKVLDSLVLIGSEELWDVLNDVAAEYSSLWILVDENTERFCLPIIQQVTADVTWHIIRIPSGEEHKQLSTCTNIWKQLTDGQADRKALLVNLGGGVIGDMGGFCAATYKRGIDFIHIPTTLLAQADASIGGKLGVDFDGLKNIIGLVQQPRMTLIYPPFLKTLPTRQLRSGYAEIIKAFIIADAESWNIVKDIKDLERMNWNVALGEAVAIKSDIVNIDPHERNTRKLLNFGHTIGHAVESYFLETDTPLLHGEAVAIGMICEAYLSYKYFTLKSTVFKEFVNYLLHLFSHTPIPTQAYPALLLKMSNDKKNTTSGLNFTLLRREGEGIINQTAAPDAVLESLRYYNSLC